MQLKIADVSILKAWIGSSGDFLAVCKGPGVGAPNDDPKTLQKWLVTSMYVLIIAYLVNIGYYAVGGGGIVTGVISFVQYAIQVFIQTWIFWYAFCKREPPCCCLCVVCIEDWKPMHLVAGVLLLLSGVLQALNAVQALLLLLSVMNLATILYIVFVVFYCLYALCMCAVGLCLIKLGGKKAGVDIPEPTKEEA